MGSYSADITKFVEHTRIKGAVFIQKLAMQGLRSVILKTPVLTSRLRGNWRVGLNQVDLTTRWQDRDPSGAKGIANGANILKDAELGDMIFITNNLSYAKKIEDGGSPVKAPEGMLKVTFVEMQIGLEVTLKSVEHL